MKKFLALVLSLILCLSLAACGSQEGGSDSKKSEEPGKEAKLTDGTYESEKEGMNDKVKVSVSIKDGKIAEVRILEHAETPGVGGELMDKDGKIVESLGKTPVELIPGEIVKNQSIGVASVSGATISSGAILAAVSDCIEKAGGDPAQFAAKPEYKLESKIEEADVVVLGGGGTGLAAAITAAQQGKDVVVIEKNGSCGGDTLVCGAIYNCPDEELQKKITMTEPIKQTIEDALKEEPVSPEHKELQDAVRAQWEEYKTSGRKDLFDTKEWYALQTWNGGDHVGNLDLVKKLTYDAYPKLQWIESINMDFSDTVALGAGALWQRSHTSKMPMGTGFLSVYGDKVQALSDKIHIVVETTAKELVKDGDRIAGVKVMDNASGEEYQIKAKDGVILATGGFSANAEMVQKYNTSGKWKDLSKVPTTNRPSCSQGDGIVMAEAVGASFTDMDQIQLLFLGNTKDGQLTKYPPRDVNGIDQIIFVNKEGNRFVREDGRRDEICLAVLDQPDAVFYMLESADGDGYVPLDDPNWRSADGFTLDYLKDNGYIFVGDSLEDIAKQIGCDPKALQKTVDRFNQSVESGKDDLNRKLFATKLEKGPWVATPRQACIHHTMGGVTIDTMGHVMDKNNKPIPGLYAGGEVTGGIHGANRLGGNAVVDTVVFGSTAAESLVADSK